MTRDEADALIERVRKAEEVLKAANDAAILQRDDIQKRRDDEGRVP